MLDTDAVILVCSRGRAEILARLVDDLVHAFVPAIEADGTRAAVLVYAQLPGEPTGLMLY